MDKQAMWQSFGLCAHCPERAIEAALAPKETAGIVAARKWLNSELPFLVIVGSVGAGKTTAATWAVMRSGLMARHIRAAELATIAPFGNSAGRWYSLRDKRLLVIDDLGTEHASDWWKSNLDSLIDFRHGQKLKTIITTNFSLPQIGDVYGLRVLDRLRQSSIFAACGTASMRGAA